MNLFTSRMVIALCTFIIGIIAATMWLSKPTSPPVTPIITEDNNDAELTITPLKKSPKVKIFPDLEALSNRVSEIELLPYEKQSGIDEAYDALIEGGEPVVPYLIDKITDTTIMPDPRGTHVTDQTTVGDVAYFVLIDITNLDFNEMLPDKVKQKSKTEGVYAYHEYIEKKGSRKQLQSKLREWYRQILARN